MVETISPRDPTRRAAVWRARASAGLFAVVAAFMALVLAGALTLLAPDLLRGQAPGAALDGGKPAAGTVRLVVDFGAASGRAPLTRDIAGFAGTGWELLEHAGLEPQGTADYPKAFVCRLAGWPSPTAEDCQSTPGGQRGYWAYYVTQAEIGPGWISSGTGAAARSSKCGDSEGWAWVDPGGSPTPPRQPPLATAARAALCGK